MRIQFLMFPVILLLAVIYIYYRIWHLIPVSHFSKWLITIALLLPVALFFGYMSYRSESSTYWFNQLVSIVGTSWMIILLYLLMTFLVIDIARLFIPAIRPWFVNNLYGTVGVTGDFHRGQPVVSPQSTRSIKYPDRQAIKPHQGDWNQRLALRLYHWQKRIERMGKYD